MEARFYFLSLLVTFFLGACTLTPRNEETSGAADSTARSSVAEPAENTPAGVNRKAVLLEETASMQFDKQGGEESFRVVLLGDSVLSGTVAFTITNDKGELIYSEEFPANMLAATYDETINTPEKQAALVRQRIGEFFGEDRFRSSAIEGDQPPHDSFFIEKATYDNLRETDAPGFIYVIGKENTKHIAWSPLEQKVVMYFNCC